MITSINNFGPFQADVWGTVSDWMIFLATSCTGLFIYFTLRSQTKVQNLQQELLIIEKGRYRKQFEPEFIVEGNNEWTSQNPINLITLSVRLIKNTAYNIRIVKKADGVFESYYRYIDEMKVNITEDLSYKKPVRHEDLLYSYNINIYFKDANRETYIQNIYGNIESPKITAPKYIGYDIPDQQYAIEEDFLHT
jgi:hypothetical protein